MLSKIRIKNFKCFKDTGPLEIRPLTILVGPNSSGKSSLLQILLMLRQTVESTDLERHLVTNSELTKVGAFSDFIHKGDINIDLSIELEFKIKKEEKFYKYYDIDNVITKLTFFYNKETTQIKLKEREILTNYKYYERLKYSEKSDKYSVSFKNIKSKRPKTWRFFNVTPLKFIDYYLRRKPSYKELPDFFSLIIGSVPYFLELNFRNIFYLGPLREFPKRFYVTSGQLPQDVGKEGGQALDVMWFSHRSKEKDIGEITKEAIKWFKKFGFAKDMRLDYESKWNVFRLLIIDPATGIETNLADTGFGASQTLPIIVESFFVSKGGLILIEQPEIHLHPKAQSILGDLFINASKDGQRNFIIETHSEHLLSRIRRRIAEGEIDKENVAIYYFEPTVEGTKIQEVKLNDNGQLISFPDGFFEEDLEEAFKHLKAIK